VVTGLDFRQYSRIAESQGWLHSQLRMMASAGVAVLVNRSSDELFNVWWLLASLQLPALTTQGI
jgi:hypothetical protein